MASFTNRFGLNRFGGQVGGSIADDGYKFTTVDRDFLDAAMRHLENHTHASYDALADPSAAPTGTLANTGGQLAPGLELHYVVTYLDRNGMETGRSASLIVNTPDVGAPPALPALVGGTGGALVTGNYNYWLTTITDGVESGPSASSSITLQTGQSSVGITVPDGVGTYNVYRQGPADGNPYKITQIDSGSTFTDTGVVAPSDVNYDPSQLLPTAGIGLPGTYSVTISVPDADADLVNGLPAWRLYSATDDTFESPALVHTVVETVNPDGGGLVTTWVDTGESRLYGQPPYVSQTMASYPADGEPEGGEGGSTGGGGGAYTENPILMDEATRTDAYGLDVGPDGGLVLVRLARYGTPYPIGYGPVLTDANAGLWLTAVRLGQVVTTKLDAATSDDTVFAHGSGPKLMLGRSSRFQLDVDLDGALLLKGLDGAPASGTGIDGAAPYGTGGEVADVPADDDDGGGGGSTLPADVDFNYATVLVGPGDARVWDVSTYVSDTIENGRSFVYSAPDASPFTITLSLAAASGAVMLVLDGPPAPGSSPKPVASGSSPLTYTPTPGHTYFIGVLPLDATGNIQLDFTVASDDGGGGGGGGGDGTFTSDFEEGY